MSATKLANLSPEANPSPHKTIEWCHINRVGARVRLLELVRGRAIDHPASELDHSEELLREWREAFRLVEQGRLRIRVAFEEVNRLPVVPDVALKLQRTRLLLCRGHKLWYALVASSKMGPSSESLHNSSCTRSEGRCDDYLVGRKNSIDRQNSLLAMVR